MFAVGIVICFGALKQLQDQGKFTDLEAHQRTIDGDVYRYIGGKEDFASRPFFM